MHLSIAIVLGRFRKRSYEKLSMKITMPLYWEVQLDFTPEIEVFHVLLSNSKYSNSKTATLISGVKFSWTTVQHQKAAKTRSAWQRKKTMNLGHGLGRIFFLSSRNMFRFIRHTASAVAAHEILGSRVHPEFLALKQESRILGHSSNPVCGFCMMEQVRLCAVWPMENWLGSSLNKIPGWTTVRESYSRALEQGSLSSPIW